MADSYERYDSEGGGGGFMMGLLTGTVLGAGLGMLLAPKAGSELRGAIGEQARNWGNTASEQYRHAREAAGNWAEKGRDMVNQARDAATHAADQARGYAGTTAGTTNHLRRQVEHVGIVVRWKHRDHGQHRVHRLRQHVRRLQAVVATGHRLHATGYGDAGSPRPVARSGRSASGARSLRQAGAAIIGT